ncbi:hypothetical protein ABEB36_014326 [Hypothenemus hampei]|uniref:DAN domain-containing protein n=1 Tax=Hypothenemus hampei TaxID=57062 RepID=A0ABD1E8M0_HYPHA
MAGPRCFYLILALLLENISSEREHRVHNIVLYPEKHSWCQTTSIQQVVASPGYNPVTIQNNVCVGACFSYSIPKSEPAEPGELIGPYCDSCQPSESKCYHVNLQSDDNNATKMLQKRVQVITSCSCQSCDNIRSDDGCSLEENSVELPLSLYVDQENQTRINEDYIHPDLFEAQNSPKQHFENDNVKLKNKLKKWFETFQNDDDKNESATPPVLDIEIKNEKIVKDLEGAPKNFRVVTPSTHHRDNHPLSMSKPIFDTSIHTGIGHHHPNDVVDRDNDQKQLHRGHHHHHHLGEEQRLGLDVTRLVRGPHGSMVAAPTEIKLHIDSDSLKPNDEGLVLEYENHHDGKVKVVTDDLVSTD